MGTRMGQIVCRTWSQNRVRRRYHKKPIKLCEDVWKSGEVGGQEVPRFDELGGANVEEGAWDLKNMRSASMDNGIIS